MKIEQLYAIINQRRQATPQESYTARLFQAGEDEIVKKIGEEAIEVILAAKSQGNLRLVEEIADLTYHLLVLMSAREITPDQIQSELSARHKPKE